MSKKTLIKKTKNKRVLHYYANDNNFSKVNVDIPKEFENQIICGDSLEVLKKLPDNCIDLHFFSPPYSFGKQYNEYDDSISDEEYFEMLFKIFDECIRTTKYGGRIAINIMPKYSTYIPTHFFIANHMINRKMIWLNSIKWEKNTRNCPWCCWGSYRSSSSPFMKHTYEYIDIYAKGSIKKQNFNHDNDDMQKLEFSDFVSTGTWSVGTETQMKKIGHPAMFPKKLAYQTLKLYSAKGDTICDVFNGAGTTTLVAFETNRKYLGIDIDEKYCEIAKDRLGDGVQEIFVLDETNQ
jgi:DNA modification methylase